MSFGIDDFRGKEAFEETKNNNKNNVINNIKNAIKEGDSSENKKNSIKNQLVHQIELEYSAHFSYINMAIQSDSSGLVNLSKFFFKQAAEELEHARKIINFLLDIDLNFRIDRILIPEVRYNNSMGKNVADILQQALNYEKELSSYIHDIYNDSANVFPEVHQFLGWFVEEQVEEVAQFQSLVNYYNIAGSNLLAFDDSSYLKSLIG